MMTIDEIVNGNYKVTEKKNLLRELRRKFMEELDQAFNKVTDGYKYCPKCREYYKEKAYEISNKKELRNVCTFYDLSETGVDKYENTMCTIWYSTCPMGHIIEEKVEHNK